MAEPLSIFSGIVGISAAAIKASKEVFELVDAVRGGPEEIRSISRDLHAFYSVVFSLNVSFKQKDVRDVISSDEAMVEMIGNLIGPLENCQIVLGALMVKIQKCDKWARMSLTSLKWGLFTKSEVRDLQVRLEATKSTLISALDTITILCSLRLLAIGKSATDPSRKWPGRSLDEKPEDGRTIMPSALAVQTFAENESPYLECEVAENRDSWAADIFYDCISRFLPDDPISSSDRFHANFSGSPDYYFESASSYYPEQYTTEGLFSRPVFVYAMMQSQRDYRIQKYFLAYAETPRRWRRIIASVTFCKVQEQSALSQVLVPDDDELTCKTLPDALESLLSTVFRRLELFYSVTSLDMSLREDEKGQMVTSSPRIDAGEDALELQMSDEEHILQDIEDLGCEQFVESDVVTISRSTSSSFDVYVKSKAYTEVKVPFATAGGQGKNGFQDCFNDLKLLHSLRGCNHVAEFFGVVLDDTRRHLKNYLYESLEICSVEKLFGVISCEPETIPWPIRELWARQIIKAISDIHGKGKIVGVLDLNSIGIRADGTAALRRFRTSERHLQNVRGIMPPELRDNSKTEGGALPKTMSFRTDIFQLGYILWLLAEQKAKTYGLFCPKNACTNFPRYSCTADHVNPVQLPPCSGNIPQYFGDIIRECRSEDPKARSPACKLAEILPINDEAKDRTIGIRELVDTYSALATSYFSVYCDECGALTTDTHYHCNICYLGNFDVCQTCFAQGIYCYVPQHRLVKRMLKNGSIVASP